MLIQIETIMKKYNHIFDFKLILITTFAACYLGTTTYLTVWSTLKFIWLLPIIIIIFGVFIIRGLISLDSIKESTTNQLPFGDKCIIWKFFFLIVIIQTIYFLAYYPGGFNLDAYGQWDQVHGKMQLNNWHPVLTTLVYWLITRINDNFAFCIFVQIVIFSASLAYLMKEIYIVTGKKKLFYGISCLIAINPAVAMNNVCLIKDVPYAIVMIWFVVVFLKIYVTRGKWLQNKFSAPTLVFLCVVLCLIRHNALFFTFPFLLLLSVYYKDYWKKWTVIIATCVITLIAIEGPIFKSLDIAQHSNVVGESVGVPMAIMANAYVYDYENTPSDVALFLESIADKSSWKEYYVTGEWDSCKWEFGGIELLKDETAGHILKMTLETAISCPETTYESLRENTRVVWQSIGYSNWNTWIYVEENDYGIREQHNPIFENIANSILNVSNTFIGNFFSWNIGVVNIIYILILLYSVLRKKEKLCAIVVPILFYNFGTMMLLCGASYRYFYFNEVLILPLIMLANVTVVPDSK